MYFNTYLASRGGTLIIVKDKTSHRPIFIDIDTNMNKCIYIYIFMYRDIYLCMHIHEFMHIYTYININIPIQPDNSKLRVWDKT
jgi:hypothetical protein